MLQEDFLAKGVEIQALGKGDSSDTQGKAGDGEGQGRRGWGTGQRCRYVMLWRGSNRGMMERGSVEKEEQPVVSSIWHLLLLLLPRHFSRA